MTETVETSTGLRTTFVGHATTLIELDGRTILTDPVWSRRIFGVLRRRQPPGMKLSALPPVDLIVLSHDHWDHLDIPTLRRLRRAHPNVAVVCPTGVDEVVRRVGFRKVVSLAWGESASLAGVEITCVPARHFSGRWLNDRNKRLWAGFVLRGRTGTTVYFAGDTGYFPEIGAVGQRFPHIDLAIVPIGAYNADEGRTFRGVHMNPDDALRGFVEVGARHLVPIHWGTFRLSMEPMTEPPARLQSAALALGLGDRVHILHPGDAWRLPESAQQ